MLFRSEIASELLDGESGVCAALAGPPSDRLFTEIGPQEGERIALVGHEPWIGELCSMCLTGSVARAIAFPFKKGGVAWLAGTPEPGAMQLRGYFAPGVLRRL